MLLKTLWYGSVYAKNIHGAATLQLELTQFVSTIVQRMDSDLIKQDPLGWSDYQHVAQWAYGAGVREVWEE